MKAYIISDITITDAALYAQHKSGAEQAAARFGGRYLVRTDAFEVLEGDCDAQRLVIIEFPDAESARGFFHSADYAGAKAIRRASARAVLRLALEFIPED